MENQQPTHTVVNLGTSSSNNSLTSRSLLKKAKGIVQLAVLIILLVMFFMNLFKAPSVNTGDNAHSDQTNAHITQLLYKMLDMPQIGALAGPVKPNYDNIPKNRTGN